MLPIRHIRKGKEEPWELVTMAEGVTRQALFVRAFTEQQPNGQESPGMSQETREAIRDLADYLDGQKDSRGIPDQYGIMHPGQMEPAARGSPDAVGQPARRAGLPHGPDGGVHSLPARAAPAGAQHEAHGNRSDESGAEDAGPDHAGRDEAKRTKTTKLMAKHWRISKNRMTDRNIQGRATDYESNWACANGHTSETYLILHRDGDNIRILGGSSWDLCDACGESPPAREAVRMRLDILRQWADGRGSSRRRNTRNSRRQWVTRLTYGPGRNGIEGALAGGASANTVETGGIPGCAYPGLPGAKHGELVSEGPTAAARDAPDAAVRAARRDGAPGRPGGEALAGSPGGLHPRHDGISLSR